MTGYADILEIRRVKPRRDVAAVRAYRKGNTLESVAAQLDLSREVVRQILVRHGITRRPVGRPPQEPWKKRRARLSK